MERSPLLAPPSQPLWQRSGSESRFFKLLENRSAFKVAQGEVNLRRGCSVFGAKNFSSRWLLAPKALEASLTHILSSTRRRLESSSPLDTPLKRVGSLACARTYACMRSGPVRMQPKKGSFSPKNDMTICLKTIYLPREKRSFSKCHSLVKSSIKV